MFYSVIPHSGSSSTESLTLTTTTFDILESKDSRIHAHVGLHPAIFIKDETYVLTAYIGQGGSVQLTYGRASDFTIATNVT